MEIDPPAQSQVKLQLSTRQADVALPPQTGPILVNTDLRRYALSTLVNRLLETEKPIPFEFLINGSFLRTSLGDYLSENGISAETVLTVEYVRAILPPTHVASFEHDDWVSSVEVLSASSIAALQGEAPLPGQERILTSSFDGFIRIWDLSSRVIATSPKSKDLGYIAAVKDARFITSSQVVSTGYDQTVRVWKYQEHESGARGSLTPELELYGHRDIVNRVDVHSPSSMMLSASADGVVGVWSTKKHEAPAAPESLIPRTAAQGNKRQKLSTAQSAAQRGAIKLLKGHPAQVTAAIFAPNDHTVAYSTSQDKTMRTWDITTGVLVDTRTTAHPLLSIAAMPDLNLIAVGTSAKHITLIDPRATATSVSSMTLRGHRNWVSALATDPESVYGLLSGSYDGTCRIWDLRFKKNDGDGVVGESVYTIPRDSTKKEKPREGGDGVKIFGVCWNKEVGIVSGGEDRKAQVNRGSGLMN